MKLNFIGGVGVDDRYDQLEGLHTISLTDIAKTSRQFFNRGNPNHIKLLSGGYSNTNYLLDYGDERFVLRFFSENQSAGKQEISVLSLAKGNGILAPEVIDFKTINGLAVAALRFLDGDPLSSLLCGRTNMTPRVFTEVGAELARIHSVQFPTAGYIGEGGNIVYEFPDFCREGKVFLLSTLKKILDIRLDPEVGQRIRESVEQHWHIVYETYKGPTLVHGDFNPKNILVIFSPEPQVTGVLDWEFSLAGHPLMDLGNFFRFEVIP